jgi:hypothetical protein
MKTPVLMTANSGVCLMGNENASAVARRVYDRVNDVATQAIHHTHLAADAVAHADNREYPEMLQAWAGIGEDLSSLLDAVRIAAEQLEEADAEVRK